MVEMTKELMEQLASEEVAGLEIGREYSNRIVMTVASGHIIIADVVSVQTAAERLEELEQRIATRANELAALEAERVAVQAVMPPADEPLTALTE